MDELGLVCPRCGSIHIHYDELAGYAMCCSCQYYSHRIEEFIPDEEEIL